MHSFKKSNLSSFKQIKYFVILDIFDYKKPKRKYIK